MKNFFSPYFPLFFLLAIASCTEKNTESNSSAVTENRDYLVSFEDTITHTFGFKNQQEEVIIPSGKYAFCFTDTLRTYAVVSAPKEGFVAIDPQGHILYQVFPFDNGPDPASDGLFRIIDNHKIGYADVLTGKVVIKPQFSCAFPFENGIAKVSDNCEHKPDGEYTSWVSDQWYYIDKTLQKVEKPKWKVRQVQ